MYLGSNIPETSRRPCISSLKTDACVEMGNSGVGGQASAGDVPPQCAEMHAAYEQCFNHWYKGFQGGKWSSADKCTDEFEDYRECYVEAMQERIKQIKERR